MNKLFFIVLLLSLSSRLFAQVPARSGTATALPPPVATREVSGIVKDASGQTVIGASITLTSTKDTLRGATNEDGIFIFKDVKMATFVVSIKGIGYLPSTRRYLNNDAIKRIVLDPVVLKTQDNLLKEVTVNGASSITYKTDTVEYRASDYKVRENATVDELLKKMEGMEVGTDGTLTHQGQQVTKARLNGKDYAGGDVAQAIQNLPAEIIEKIQVVDDYGDQAGRTGVKSGDPTKVLNMTTRADKSVGNLLRITASGGNNDRYDERVFAQRINANQQIGIIGNIRNTVNGVASSGISTTATTGGGGGGNGGGGGGNGGGGGGNTGNVGGSTGSGGTTTSGGPSFNYRDQWGKYIQINAAYRYTFNDVNSISNSTGQTFSSLGTTNFTRNGTSTNNSKSHVASFEFEYSPDSSNFLRVTPSFSYNGSTSLSDNETTQVGLQNQYSKILSTGKNTTPTYGAIVLYQYIFKKNHRRNISLQLNLTHSNQQQNTISTNDLQFRNAQQNLLKDSLTHRELDRGNITKNYRASLTYVEPLTPISQLEFNAQMNYRGYDNSAITDSIAPNGNLIMLNAYSNLYNYSFTENRIALNYRLNKPKYNISFGFTAIPTHLQGTNISKSTSTDRNDFYLVPLFRFQYQWSRQQQISINYNGTTTEPTFTQIQPVPDYTDLQNPVFGNPDLKPSFTHAIVTRYNNYISNSKVNLSANIQANLYQNQIATNIVQVAQKGLNNYINETHYINLSGAKRIQGNYNIAKQFDDRRYNLSLNGTASYDYALGMSNNLLNHTTSWDISERFGPRINPNTTIEFNPFVAYEIHRSFNTLSYTSSMSNTDYTKTSINLEGKFYFFKDKTWTFEYDLSKNYINGLSSNVTKNPFVVNAYIEKEFFQRKNGILRISAFDILNQNNFINRTVTTNSITDTKTNALSRYVMVSFILNLQKWTGIAQRNGRNMQRRGDGSFIY
jgi:hypothetical protein